MFQEAWYQQSHRLVLKSFLPPSLSFGVCYIFVHFHRHHSHGARGFSGLLTHSKLKMQLGQVAYDVPLEPWFGSSWWLLAQYHDLTKLEAIWLASCLGEYHCWDIFHVYQAKTPTCLGVWTLLAASRQLSGIGCCLARCLGYVLLKASFDIGIGIDAIELFSMGFTNDWHHLFPLLVSWKTHSPNACIWLYLSTTPCWHKTWISPEPSNLAKVESCAIK